MTLIPEKVDVEEVERKLKELGWEDSGLKNLLINGRKDFSYFLLFFKLSWKWDF